MLEGVPESQGSLMENARHVMVDGACVHYVRAGAGRPLVLIHGLTGSTENWRRNIESLAERSAVYALDLMNMGRSDRVAGIDTGLGATADRVEAWMSALDLTDADIVGHSHGGAIAMMLAARHPQRVRSLMLFAPANPYSHLGDRLLWMYHSAPGRLFAQTVPFLPRWMQQVGLGRMYGDPARIVPGTLEGYTRGLRIPGTMDHILTIVRNWWREMDLLRAALPQLASTPVLLVWGDCDRAVSLQSGVCLHSELPSSELVVVPGAGHVPFEEMPESCNRAMLRWLDDLGSTRKPVQGATRLEPRYDSNQGVAAARVAVSSASAGVARPVRPAQMGT